MLTINEKTFSKIFQIKSELGYLDKFLRESITSKTNIDLYANPIDSSDLQYMLMDNFESEYSIIKQLFDRFGNYGFNIYSKSEYNKKREIQNNNHLIESLDDLNAVKFKRDTPEIGFVKNFKMSEESVLKDIEKGIYNISNKTFHDVIYLSYLIMNSKQYLNVEEIEFSEDVDEIASLRIENYDSLVVSILKTMIDLVNEYAKVGVAISFGDLISNLGNHAVITDKNLLSNLLENCNDRDKEYVQFTLDNTKESSEFISNNKSEIDERINTINHDLMTVPLTDVQIGFFYCNYILVASAPSSDKVVSMIVELKEIDGSLDVVINHNNGTKEVAEKQLIDMIRYDITLFKGIKAIVNKQYKTLEDSRTIADATIKHILTKPDADFKKDLDISKIQSNISCENILNPHSCVVSICSKNKNLQTDLVDFIKNPQYEEANLYIMDYISKNHFTDISDFELDGLFKITNEKIDNLLDYSKNIMKEVEGK